MRRQIYANDFNDFLGLGVSETPIAGELDGALWTVEGFSTLSDLSRGETDGGVSTGGFYALNRADGDNALYLQPGGSDFTPGSLTLALDSGDTDLSDVVVSFERLVNNDQARSNSFDLSFSLDGVTFSPLDTFASGGAPDVNGVAASTVAVPLPDLPANSTVYLRWSGDDVAGSGARDEFGLDNLLVDGLEATDGEGGVFTLELLHIADQEASSSAVVDAPNLSAVLNALRDQDLGDDGIADNTLTLSSGDAIIPGVFFDASEAIFGSAGIADIQIQNELGIQAIALGNHEFDFGTEALAELISGDAPGDVFGTDFGGTEFAYLSANLDFSTDANLAPLEVAGGAAPMGNTVTSSVVLESGGETIGVIGATTPTLGRISSPGDLAILPGDFDDTPTPAQLDALAAQIQTEVDALLAADPSMNKIILLSHMQRLSIEQELAARLEHVDVIVAGGSNTRLFDETDRPRDGDSVQGEYPIFIENASGTQTAVVNTDGSYKYVGRLVIDFDEDGNIIPGSYDPDISGAYATDAQGVADLNAEGLVDPEIQAIADAIEAQIIATESNVFGASEVFLNGNRSGAEGDPDGVRTQETNLGNLTADANLAAAKEIDDTVVVSIKNGGGIRASIGESVVLPGDTVATRLPNGELVDGDGNVIKPEGGISQNDIQTTLAFNNGLTLLTLTKAELVAVLEHGVGGLPGVAGRFPQVSGVEFSFDPDLPAGGRIVNAEIVDETGGQIAELVRDGAISGDASQEFRIVTLNFLAGGGDGFPFPEGDSANRVDLAEDGGPRTGEATFADDGSEQDALAEFLADLDTPFAEADTDPSGDARIQNLNFRDDTVFEGGGGEESVVINEVLSSTAGTDSEYIELFGTPGASLDGLSLIAVESDAGTSKGTIDFRLDFDAGTVLGDNGFLLLANQTAEATYGVTANIAIPANALENGSSTFALVETASLSGDALTGSEVVIDSVATLDADGDTADLGAPAVGPDGTFLPAGLGRIEDGVDTDTAADFEILSFGNDPEVNTPTAGTGLGGGGGGGGSIDDAPTLISDIQGSGAASDLVGQTVVVEAIVTGDFQNGDGDSFRDLGGFFLMEETDDQDDSTATSEGIFAFEGGGDLLSDVEDGDKVRVLGTVIERFGKTTIEVREIRVEEAGAVDPLSLAQSIELPDLDDREAYESMLVTVDEALTFSESFDYEDFGRAVLTSDGPVYQYSQLNTPDVAGNAAYLEEVANRTIAIDDGTNTQRGDFDPITLPDGSLVEGPVDGVRMGQSVDGLTAIMDFDFGEFRLRLPEGEEFDLDEDTNPVPTEPEDVGSDYKVGSLNVLNYFTTLGGQIDNGENARGAENPEELARQTEKLVQTILGMDSDVIGLIEIENDFAGDEFAIKTLVGELNAAVGSEVWSFVDPGREFVGDDAIAVAFIYDTTTTKLVGDAAVLDTDAFLDPLGAGQGGDAFNRAALAQSFEQIETGGVFTASVNHLKSKGSPTGAVEDQDQGDGAGRNNATRELAAQELAAWLETDPTGVDDEDVMILGDLNAYARETPIQVLEAAGYTDLARELEGDDVYSYRFSGQIGTLDYVLANDALKDQVTGATTWNVNADTPVFFDYNLDDTFTDPNTQRPIDQGLFDGSSPLRGSDHDPVVVGLDLDRDSPLLIAGTEKNDRLFGTDSAERIVSGGGRLDVMSGGGEADTFVFTDTDDRRDSLRILDFEAGLDTLDLDGAVIAAVRTLGRDNLLLQLDEDRDSIFLRGIDDLDDITIINEGVLDIA
ncbi:ExeM/NucH family extracellular endonuclease [Roseobacter sinensis]|uniref:ExeM/NucH family extracellular endonuclease n=1 Tax=Roseobacter sinensis TaxID=2931391 RepID=A0ABT3BEZ5_9RHOB|nr:ExeM/NucH family extracellular endonuclease [Roseobacter sp. WL0113]MCV3272127.1 ExeM/NucH family extracellular endonuclease [Roseobacter sp. WL0113]